MQEMGLEVGIIEVFVREILLRRRQPDEQRFAGESKGDCEIIAPATFRQ